MFEVLFAILGMGALASVFGAFDDHSDEEGKDDNQHVVGPEDTLNAGDGNDTITDGPNGAYGASIDGGSGDDKIDLSHNPTGDVRIDGGGGSDTIESVHQGNYSGGDGRDVITAQGSDTIIYGGAGADTLTLSRPGIHGNTGYGGAGDDSLTAISAVTQDLYNHGSFLNGGAGKDLFTFQIIGVDDPATAPDDPEFGEVSQIGRIGDFDPTSDKLVVDLSELPSGSPVMESMQLDGDTLTLIFDNGARATIQISGLPHPDLSVSDIRVIGAGSGKILDLEGPETIRAGDGNDFLEVRHPANSLDQSVVYGGGGDDFVSIGINPSEDSFELYGGAGNDVLSGFGQDLVIKGGPGDDVLTGYGKGSVLTGGAGNDQLSVNSDVIGAPMRANGGVGDDTLTASGAYFGNEVSGAVLIGGQGADTFNMYLRDFNQFGPERNGEDGEFASITDFDPTKDRLVIDMNTREDGAPTNDIQLVLSAAGSGQPSYVLLNYSNGTTSRISLAGIDASSGFARSDIEVLRD